MPGFTWANPFPMSFGGAETETELVYRALRATVGQGGFAEDDTNTVEGLWRQARAVGIASFMSFGERSALQAFPDHATDALPYYEQLLLLTNDPATSEQDRREAVAFQYALQIASAIPDIATALQVIDPRFAVLATSFDQADVTVFGRAFEDFAGVESFNGGRKSTAFPNYSTELVLFVLLDLGSGNVPSPRERRAMDSARRLLGEVLPAFNDFQIVTHRGFTLDVDRLDLTSFGA